MEYQNSEAELRTKFISVYRKATMDDKMSCDTSPKTGLFQVTFY